jgi:hypothetical protein
MKKILALLALGCIAQPALAANNINNLQLLTQSQFQDFSADLGSALSYKPVTPAASLGVTGFDIGIEATDTKMAKSSQLWGTVTGSGNSVNNLIIPKLHVAKGLPFGIDVAAFYSQVPTTNIKLYGAELRYAILEGGIAEPAIALRGAFTKLAGVSQLAFDTKSLDLSVSKGFTLLTPYIGVGEVWTTSNPDSATGLSQVKVTQNKVFGGVNLNMGFTNLALELDKTGSAQSTSLKFGFRF